ncbi:hypothetical protein ElyMa_003016700 [Elysia marginata]|uniref:Uncharacterized protein n=1 Tax=Elysia marginata TaxID=1093978 RepID=A0AAV4IJK4_9GAST|nr:hypothetical protein ElyMa_003016700 [Elysia marginata]
MSCCYQGVRVRYRRGSLLDAHRVNPFRVCRRGSMLGRTLRQPIQGIQERVYVGTHTASTHPGYAGEALRWDAHCVNPSRVYRRGSTLGCTLRQPIQGMQERLYVGTHTASTHPG